MSEKGRKNGNIRVIFLQKGNNMKGWESMLLFVGADVTSFPVPDLPIVAPAPQSKVICKLAYQNNSGPTPPEKKILSDLPFVLSLAAKTHFKPTSLRLSSVNSITFLSGYFSWQC